MNRNIVLLILIIVLAAVAIYIDLPNSPGVHIALGPLKVDGDFKVRQGLDLRGGVQVLLVADVLTDTVDAEAMQQAVTIVENRVNALGLTEPVVQRQGGRRLIVELPGVEDPEAAVATIRETGLLEFVDAGYQILLPGTVVRTTYPDLWADGATTHAVSVTVPVTATGALTTTVTTQTQMVYATVLAGNDLKAANATTNTSSGSGPGVAFVLSDQGAQVFERFTTEHVGTDAQPYYLSIVLDKHVISSPRIREPITGGQGEISGGFESLKEAQDLALQLRYGALPIPLKVESYRAVGPTLGHESVQRSVRAGVVGLSIVLLFMLLYYRLPGLLADLALILYGLFNFALYKAIPVTLTLPAITGFILSTGMAVDANILVFERMKEELRAGRKLAPAIEAGFSRAWTSIRDSNISTLITCAILFYFGSAFGAGSVKGFAMTLALGVIINLFTAITVTRTLMPPLPPTCSS